MAASIFLFSVRPGIAATSGKASPSADPICGPPCIQTVLRLYGRRGYELDQLIAETQTEGVYNGASLRSLEKALESRRIYAAPIFVGVDETIEWPFPVIVHLDSNNSLGHFIVARRLNQETAAITDPTSPLRQDLGELWSQRSGAILLTSPRPIGRAEIAAATKRSVLGYATLACFVANSIALLAFLAMRYGPWRIRIRNAPPVGGTQPLHY